MARIFLCHASEDKAQVRKVYDRLHAIDGFEPWLDEEDLLPGQDWDYEIKKALKTSDFILIFFSRLSVAKHGYVQREMKLALDALQELPEGTIHTIPVRLDDCELPESFQRYHYANLFVRNGFNRIVLAIRAEIAKRLPKPSLSTIRISLAASSELREDLNAFELFFRQQTDQLLKKGVYLEIVRWEIFLDDMPDARFQDEYNRAIGDCDIFVGLFFIKTGNFTDEFDIVHRQFEASGKPRIYTFFKNAEIKASDVRLEDLASLWAFQEKLSRLGHFHARYDNIAHLTLQFRDQLDKIARGTRLTVENT